jgi:hypothetical protein
MAIDAVAADIEFAANKPSGFTFMEITLREACPRVQPVDKSIGLCFPEDFRLFQGALVHGFVIWARDESSLRCLRGDRVCLDFKHMISLLKRAVPE